MRTGTADFSGSPCFRQVSILRRVVARLNGGAVMDLVIRDAGDNTLTLYPSNGQGGFLPRITLATDPGVSDVSLADLKL